GHLGAVDDALPRQDGTRRSDRPDALARGRPADPDRADAERRPGSALRAPSPHRLARRAPRGALSLRAAPCQRCDPSAHSAARGGRPVTAALLALKPRTFGSLRNHRNYRLYFTGQIVSVTGTWMQDTALPWLILGLTHSPIYVGGLVFARYAPFLAFGLFSG